MSEKDGVTLIAEERKRQIEEEGWSAEHDAEEHFPGQLGMAGAAYALDASGYDGAEEDFWPWDGEWWKPTDDHVRQLTKAGALIAAEIDKIQNEGKIPTRH